MTYSRIKVQAELILPSLQAGRMRPSLLNSQKIWATFRLCMSTVTFPDNNNSTIMELKLFTNLIDALGKGAGAKGHCQPGPKRGCRRCVDAGRDPMARSRPRSTW